ncbi:hypothetical protein DPMN_103514 [Dreissena polymorpha]|uniref:Uncharacterized protein n=1 Tax=Dreissena polymorpha TaxID=45954 RepID=A0A9D4H804_DREPO|nr:hypothetical protein DPMN_103514 [Dreissena polymorpha]
MGIQTKKICLYSIFSKDSQATVILVLNVRSLPNHSADVLKDPTFLMSDVIVLIETWLSGTIAFCTLLPSGQFNVQLVDRRSPAANCHRSASGVLVAVKMP